MKDVGTSRGNPSSVPTAKGWRAPFTQQNSKKYQVTYMVIFFSTGESYNYSDESLKDPTIVVHEAKELL